MKRYDITFRGVDASGLAQILAGARNDIGRLPADPEIAEHREPGSVGAGTHIVNFTGDPERFRDLMQQFLAEAASSGIDRGEA